MSTILQLSWWLEDVGPNLIASALCFIAASVWAWRKWAPAVREHVRKVHELHAHFVEKR